MISVFGSRISDLHQRGPSARPGTARAPKKIIVFDKTTVLRWAARAVDDDHLRILRALSLNSAMIVPLRGRERVFGALTFVLYPLSVAHANDFAGSNDFVAVAGLGSQPFVFSVHPSLPARNVKELVALAKAGARVVLNDLPGAAEEAAEEPTYLTCGADEPKRVEGTLQTPEGSRPVLYQRCIPEEQDGDGQDRPPAVVVQESQVRVEIDLRQAIGICAGDQILIDERIRIRCARIRRAARDDERDAGLEPVGRGLVDRDGAVSG